MGVYSNNRTQLGTYSAEEIVANESYSHQTGLLEMVIDNAKNDQAIFEAVITNDFKEAAGVVQESAEVLQESVSGFIDKVKAFIKKCWEKVKAIFKSFLVKINNVIIRDNKEFVNKYKKEVLSKDLSKMKYKWSKPKDTVEDGTDGIDKIGVLATSRYLEVQKVPDTTKIEEALNSGDDLDEMLSDALTSGNTTVSEFSKDYHEDCFEDVDTEEGLDTSRLMSIINVLTNSAVTLKSISKIQKDADKMYADMLKTIDKSRNVILKKIPGKDDNAVADASNAEILKRQNLGYRVVQMMQTGTQKIIGAAMTATKFHIAQSRRVFAQAAAFNPKSVRENAMFIEAVGESAEYEINSSFEDYSL